MTQNFFLIGLAFIGSFSPLLTITALWQIKEWRIDRLREHLKTEGFFSQLFGRTRPVTIVIFFWLGLFFKWPLNLISIALLTALSLLTVLQITTARQRFPVRTKKTLILLGLSLLFNLLFAAAFISQKINLVLIFMPVLQPFFLFSAWLFFKPLDYYVKRIIMEKARVLRAAFSDLTVVGITGSVGKTTTKELLAHVLQDFKPLVTPAHVNSEMGISKWLTSKLPSHNFSGKKRIMIVEMGAYRIGEIKKLCQIAQPKIGIVTHIGSQHLALFGSQEAIFQAKGELVEALPENGLAILNGDNNLCSLLAERAPCRTILVGTEGKKDYEAFDIEETSTGIKFRVNGQNYQIPLHGTHNVTNVLLVIAAAASLGLPPPETAAKIKTFSPLSKTFNVTCEKNITILNDTHNSSPHSLRAAIAWARSQPYDKKTLLCSGLIELGQNRDEVHAEVGAGSAGVFDRVIFLNKNAAKAFAKGYGKPVEIYGKKTGPVEPDSLLVCVGRMPSETIRSLLPR